MITTRWQLLLGANKVYALYECQYKYAQVHNYMLISFILGYEGRKLEDEAKGVDVTFQVLDVAPDWNYRAVMVMTPLPGDSADDSPKARYFKNLRVLDIAWIAIFNKAMTVKGHQYQPGGMVAFGSYG